MAMDFSPTIANIDDSVPSEKDIEGTAQTMETNNTRPRLRTVVRIVGLKMILNPNIYTCVLGVAWAVIAHRFKVKMPGIVKESIQILSRAALRTATFNIGKYIHRSAETGDSLWHENDIFGNGLEVYCWTSSYDREFLVMGLHGNVLKIAIIQAALPLAITTFIFAKEYGLHANVLSTGVIFGTLASLPLLIAYYAVLEVI